MLLASNYLQGANDARRPDLMTEAVGQGVGFVKERRAILDTQLPGGASQSAAL